MFLHLPCMPNIREDLLDVKAYEVAQSGQPVYAAKETWDEYLMMIIELQHEALEISRITGFQSSSIVVN